MRPLGDSWVLYLPWILMYIEVWPLGDSVHFLPNAYDTLYGV